MNNFLSRQQPTLPFLYERVEDEERTAALLNREVQPHQMDAERTDGSMWLRAPLHHGNRLALGGLLARGLPCRCVLLGGQGGGSWLGMSGRSRGSRRRLLFRPRSLAHVALGAPYNGSLGRCRPLSLFVLLDGVRPAPPAFSGYCAPGCAVAAELNQAPVLERASRDAVAVVIVGVAVGRASRG